MNTALRRGLAVASVLVFTASLVWLATEAHAVTGHCRPAWCAHVTVVGHRAEQGPNENTLVALRWDRINGASFETDQWNLADGTPVIFHGYGPGGIHLGDQVDPASMPPGVTPDSVPGDLTLDQWRQLRTKGGEPLPTLHQWITHAQRWKVPGMVEIKYTPVDPAKIAAWVRRSSVPISFYSSPNVYRGVCHQSGAQAMRDVGMVVGLKYNPACPQTLTESADWGYSYVITSASVITRGYVTQAHGLGLKVGNYLSGRAGWAALVRARVDYLLVPHVRRAERWLS